MYHTGELIKFSPFVFKNGNQPKPKYCIVLGQIDDKVMMVSLPTSKDHVPSDVTLEHGCVDIPERGVNAFVFNPSDQVTSSFSFPRPTFVYGEQVDEYEQKYLDEMGGTIERLGQIDPVMFQAIKDCLKKARLLRRKYRKLL